MARLVEISGQLPCSIELRCGDVLHIQASGGYVQEGVRVAEALGPFVPAVLGLHGRILSPESRPAYLLVRALNPGRATVLLFLAGEPGAARRHEMVLEVDRG